VGDHGCCGKEWKKKIIWVHLGNRKLDDHDFKKKKNHEDLNPDHLPIKGAHATRHVAMIGFHDTGHALPIPQKKKKGKKSNYRVNFLENSRPPIMTSSSPNKCMTSF